MRVEFVGRLPRLEYLKLYNRIDFGLDPAPYGGHTTSLDAFWMGVPTITLVSDQTAMGRAGWSQLCNLGLQELAAETPDEYVAIAARLAGELSRLQEIARNLAAADAAVAADGRRGSRAAHGGSVSTNVASVVPGSAAGLTSASHRAANRAERAADGLRERGDHADGRDNNQAQHHRILDSGRTIFAEQELRDRCKWRQAS